MEKASIPGAWLVSVSGSADGRRHPLRSTVTSIGRDPQCDICLSGPAAATVSLRHAEVRRENGTYLVVDLGSTNGTYLNGERIEKSELVDGAVVRLGAGGPEFRLEAGSPAPVDLEKTMVGAPEPVPKQVPLPPSGEHDGLLSDAIEKARQAREIGEAGQTMAIMRDMLGEAIHRSGRKHRRIIKVLVITLLVVIAFSAWRIISLGNQLSDIDGQIAAVETKLGEGGLESDELDDLVDRLDRYQARARELQDSMFYQLGLQGREQEFIEREIRVLMAEFGAEQYSIPPEFTEQVKRYLERLRTTERATVEKVVGGRRDDLNQMRNIFAAENLPPDLAYMVLIESSFITQSASAKGAAGLWQFTPASARAYGMKVNDEVDERYDLTKSTQAAGRYIRELILDFGAGSSVMLALAAYNLGPGRVKRAVRKVEDPIKQRNFWYLYRVKALPIETRQYVPKIIAAIIVGRNLDRFGF